MRVPVLTALFMIAAWPGSGVAADALPKVPPVVGDFLAYCPQHQKACADYVGLADVALMLKSTASQGTNSGGVIYCSTDDFDDTRALRETSAWLKARPEMARRPTENGLDAALIALYPCKPSPDKYPQLTAEFVKFCQSHAKDCEEDISNISLAMILRSDAAFCPPDPRKQTDAEADAEYAADMKAVKAWLAAHQKIIPRSSAAIRQAWHELYPCAP